MQIPFCCRKKHARVVERYAEEQNLSLDAALQFLYRSEVYHLMRQGVSDMHCMSDAYLAQELCLELAEKERPSAQ